MTPDTDLDLADLTSAELRMVEIAVCEWEKSDDPHARRVARLYRSIMSSATHVANKLKPKPKELS